MAGQQYSFLDRTGLARVWARCKEVFSQVGHKHSASDITSGTLPVSRGGTGNATGNAATATKLQTARVMITDLTSDKEEAFDGTSGISPGVYGVLPIEHGGTGGSTVREAQMQLHFGARIQSDVDVEGDVDYNDIWSMGIYDVYGHVNGPLDRSTDYWCSLICLPINNSASYVTQVAIPIVDHSIFLRIKNGSSFGVWYRMAEEQA